MNEVRSVGVFSVGVLRGVLKGRQGVAEIKNPTPRKV